MTDKQEGRSSRIVEEATRIIDLTTRIEAALAVARDLASERRVAARSLASLIEADPLTDLAVSPPANRLIADGVLLVAMRAGSNGISPESLHAAIYKRLGYKLLPEDIDRAINMLISSEELVSKLGRYFANDRKRVRLPDGGRSTDRPTHREMILRVLEASPRPLGVAAIVKAVGDLFSQNIARTSVSPLLTKLEDRGEVLHVGERWTVPKA